MTVIGIFLILYIIFEPSIDKTKEGKYLLWFTKNKKRVYIILN